MPDIPIKDAREIVKTRAGRGPDWDAKVDEMSDRQVMAIYRRLAAQGRL